MYLNVGDLWYNPTTKVTKRWNGTSWEEQDVKDKVAQEIAKSKNTVFVSTPVPPYKIGDLWIKNQEIYDCISVKESGVFAEGDWKKSTKYTDDTTANTAINNQIKGNLTINANTIFDGTATFVSQGSNETTIIKDGSITFTRNNIPTTVIRNMRFGTAIASSSGGDIITLSGFDDSKTKVLPSLMEFSVSNTVRTLECKATKVGVNQWRFYLRGTENTVVSANPVTTSGASATHPNVYSATFHNYIVSTGAVSYGDWTFHSSTTTPSSPPIKPTNTSPSITFTSRVNRNGTTTEIQSISLGDKLTNYKVDVSQWFPYTDGNTVGTIIFDVKYSSITGKEWKIESETHTNGATWKLYYRNTSISSASISNLTTEGFVDLLVNYQGGGRIQYIAFEE